MDALLDQRHMYQPIPSHVDGKPTGAPARIETPDDVAAYWQAFAETRHINGLHRFELAPGREKPARSRQALDAYVNEGRWVAQCPGGPNGDCNGGIACWPDHEHGCCLDCGTVYPIRFPAVHEIAAATQALLARPPEHRHWHPGDGETVATLKEENLRHGFGLTPEQEAMRVLAGAEQKIPDEVRAVAEKLLALPDPQLAALRRIFDGEDG